MSGEVVTIWVPKIESSEPRLWPDTYNQNRSVDDSFEQKLKFEQARLGLLFSPFPQLSSLFSPQNLVFNRNPEKELNNYLTSEPAKVNNYSQPQPQSYPKTTVSQPSPPQIFESFPTKSFNHQFWQNLLYQTNWLIPNLEAQPLFYQAFLEGKLQPKLDLQFLVEQIINQVNLVKEKGRTELVLSLKPENLGEILLVLTAHSGMVSIQIQVPQETKKLLEAEIEKLKKSLRKAKVNFDKIEIEEVQKYAS
ncbi:MAG: flagellar hook-length control protein FliK [Candidatus Margulisiibacteriota bacterium]